MLKQIEEFSYICEGFEISFIYCAAYKPRIFGTFLAPKWPIHESMKIYKMDILKQKR